MVTRKDADLVVRARRVVLPGGIQAAAVHTAEGRIVAVTGYDDAPPPAVTLPDDEVLLPGLVDSHVHVNEPGRTEWEGFATATRAAAAGGVTTIVDMPLNSIPPTVSVEALHVKRRLRRARSRSMSRSGAVPCRATPTSSGRCSRQASWASSASCSTPVCRSSRRWTTRGCATALAELAAVDGLLIAHAEDAAVLAAAPAPGGPSYAAFLASRPGAAEESAIGRLLAAALDTGARVHVVHLADADALPMLRRARAEGVR